MNTKYNSSASLFFLTPVTDGYIAQQHEILELHAHFFKNTGSHCMTALHLCIVIITVSYESVSEAGYHQPRDRIHVNQT